MQYSVFPRIRDVEKLKNIGGCLLGAVGFAALLTLTVLFFLGAERVSVHMLPWLWHGCTIAIAILLVLLPLSAIKRARGFTSATIFVISFIFGISAWMDGLLVTLSTWGVVAAIIGLCIGGIGVVPLGILAALFHGQWEQMFELIILIVLTFGCRFFSVWLDGKNQTHKTSQMLLEGETSFEEEP
jgi:hypothetical protein